MKWFPKGKATWPLEDMPTRYFADNPSVPALGAANEILASMVRAIDQLEARVESLERQVHGMNGKVLLADVEKVGEQGS